MDWGGDCGFDGSAARPPEPDASTQGAGFGYGPLGPGYDFNHDGKLSLPEQLSPNAIDDLYGLDSPSGGARRGSSFGCSDVVTGCFALAVFLVVGAFLLWLMITALV